MTPSFRIQKVILSCLALIVAAGLAGCSFSPEFKEGTIACTAGKANTCPPGFTCAAGFCRSRPVADGAADAPLFSDVAGSVSLDATALDQSADENLAVVDTSVGIDIASINDVRPAFDRAVDSRVGTIDLGPAGVDSGIDSDSGPDSPDAPGPTDLAPDKPLSTDVAVDVIIPPPTDGPACTESCKPTNTRCTPEGVQTCAIVNGCPTWGLAVPCDGRKVCQLGTCVCPVAPVGCESGAGSVCAGNNLRTCKVGTADGCIYEDSSLVCGAGKPCQGAFPSAACTCPPPPTACNGAQGTFCESIGMVVTCGLDANGCLSAIQRTGCPSDKPCTGAFPSASCSCGAGPPECGNSTGKVCVGSGKIETCALDSGGCLAVASIADCPSGTTCQGAAPNAACQCPPTPAECSQGEGDSCNTQGQVVTCARDTNRCLVVTNRATCPGVTKCGGTFPSASCRCPTPPAYCTGKGDVCVDSATLAACRADGEGCLTSTTMSCTPAGQTCQGSIPDAKCECVPNPNCPSGAGTRCSDDTTLLTCTETSGRCLLYAKTQCKAGQYCVTNTSGATCELPKPVGWYTDLEYQGNKTASVLMGYSVTVQSKSILRSIGLISRGEGNAQLAIYASDTSGAPTTLVAYASPVAVTVGRNEFAPNYPTSKVTLQAGNYWVMAVYQTQMSIAQSSSSTSTVPRRYLTFDYGALFPTTLPASTSGLFVPSNYYILVTPQ